MILEHYSAAPLKGGPRNYRQLGRRLEGWKPDGLWVSVKGEYDWPWWCEAEDFRPENLAVCTRVHLSEAANIKIIRNAAELEAFDRDYGLNEPLGDSGYVHHTIDFKRLAKEYDGIIIAPYLWSHRLRQGFSWYYGWDCASGCIWNGKKAIASFELAKEDA